LKKTGLYIHFPFCRRACFYCHFFKKKFQAEKAASWLQHLGLEMRLRRDPERCIDTVYFGGGSPSLLDPGRVAVLIEAAAAHFNVSNRAEITLETNPEDLSLSLLKSLRAAGINRLSIGVQSFQERDLRFLKRTHTATQALRAMTMAHDAGFANVSVDQIIGLPTQTEKSMALNSAAIQALDPAHVSVYILERVPLKRPPLGGGDRDARLYANARQSLVALGFEHYEVSNFCRPGHSSRHNLKYWRMEPYIGLGPSAAGFVDGVDYRNCADLKEYNAALGNGKLPLVITKQMDPAKRRIITGLRLLDGIPASAFKFFSTPTDFLLSEGFLVRRGPNIAVPPEKILLLNEILGYFI
jgi:oxygen-independent coproporphyrinogen-3 oxidase